MPPTPASEPDRITVTWRLSARGRALARQAGGDAAIIQRAIVTPGHPAWPRALPLARIDWTGRRLLDVDRDPLSGRAYAFDTAVELDEVLDAAEVVDATGWALEHGSVRLRHLATQRLLHVCMPLYWDERLTAERPGWSWPDELAGTDTDPPADPPKVILTWLAEARRIDPTARLRCWRIDPDEARARDGYLPGSMSRLPGPASFYAVLGQFRGRPVVALGPPCLDPSRTTT